MQGVCLLYKSHLSYGVTAAPLTDKRRSLIRPVLLQWGFDNLLNRNWEPSHYIVIYALLPAGRSLSSWRWLSCPVASVCAISLETRVRKHTAFIILVARN